MRREPGAGGLATVAVILSAIVALALAPAGASAAPLDYRTDVTLMESDDAASATAECPGKRTLTGGGGSIAATGFAIRVLPFLNTTAPIGSGSDLQLWRTWAQNTLTGGGNVTSHAICLRRKLGRPRAVTASAHVPPEHDGTAIAYCPDGTRVAGGGVIVSGAVDEAWISESRPIDTGDADLKPDDGWFGTVYNVTDSSAKSVNATALCLKRSKRNKLRYRSQISNNSTLATARCPAGTQVTGGGGGVPDAIADPLVEASVPVELGDPDPLPDDGWTFSTTGDSGENRVEAFAVCRKQ